MPDIAKCSGQFCDIKERCFRYTAPSCKRQVWMTPPNPGPACEYFWCLSDGDTEGDYQEGSYYDEWPDSGDDDA